MLANPTQAVLMLLNLAFNREEQLKLESLTSLAGMPKTFKELLETWAETPRQIASGAIDTAFARQYSKGLEARTALEKILQLSPTPLQNKLEQVLGRFDGDFKRLTRDDGGVSLAHIGGPKDGWWWTRAPLAATGP